MHLLEPYIHQGHHLFTDRYYSSIPLAQALHDNETAFTGTCVRDRVDLPDIIRGGQTPGEGEVMAFRDDRLMALTWRAKKKKAPVVMLSTECSAQMVTVPSRHSGAAAQKKPIAVHTYNQNMNGVDISDQYTATYPFTRKTIKWWRKVFFWLIDLCVTNSYAVYREMEQDKIPHIAYRRSIVEALATRYLSSSPPRPRVGRPRKRSHPDTDPERLNGHLHLLGKRQQRDCVVCSSQSASGNRHRSTYYCKTCPNNPSLCPDECFERYHTLHNYKLY